MYFCCLICIFSIMEFILMYEGMSSVSCVHPSLHVPSSLDSLDLQTFSSPLLRYTWRHCTEERAHMPRSAESFLRSNFPSSDALVSMLETLRNILIKQRRESEWVEKRKHRSSWRLSMAERERIHWKHDKHKREERRIKANRRITRLFAIWDEEITASILMEF